MKDINVIKARLGKRDKDIQRAIKLLDLNEIIISDLVREGFRKVLIERGLLEDGIGNGQKNNPQ